MALALKVVIVVLVVLACRGRAADAQAPPRRDARTLPAQRAPPDVAPAVALRALQGFRLLDGPLERPPAPRPRLDPDRHYVFSETSAGDGEVMPTHLRHDDDWALSLRSAPASSGLRVGVVALVVVVIVGVVTYYLRPALGTIRRAGHDDDHQAAITTTSTGPAGGIRRAVDGGDVDYAVPLAGYRVTVTGARGPTWASSRWVPRARSSGRARSSKAPWSP